MSNTTREQWLNDLTTALRPRFSDVGKPLPEKIRVTCGWPSQKALAKRKRRIGECWNPMCSKDGTTEISISPVLEDGVEVAAVLVHELCHAATPGAKHKKPFSSLAAKMGLQGPWTATSATEEGKLALALILPGSYPHATLDMSQVAKEKTQSTRLVKVECDECGYTLRTTRKWLEEKGAPICPCNLKPMLADGQVREDEEESEKEAA